MTAPQAARGLIVAAPHSGAGKTTATLAILSALRQRGIRVRAAKAGPDYIDPAFHAAATGYPSVNLDSWAMPPTLLDGLAARAAADAALLVIEGVMGLFDGAAGPAARSGTTADLAAHFGLPVVLVLDVARQAQSAAALVRGFATHDGAVRIAGVILNRVGSERHRVLIADAIAALGVPVFGAVPREAALALPERHLGLVQAAEHPDLAALMGRLAAVAERHLDLDAIAACGSPLRIAAASASAAVPPPGQRIALARDPAFSFIYPHVIAAWRNAGALAAARRFHEGLRKFAATRPVHGECGGYMVLGEGLEDADGRHHAMAGLLGHATSFAKRKLHLGYRTARLLAGGTLGAKGATVRGHEFHYASLIEAGGDPPFAEITDAAGAALGNAGGRRGRVTGTFFHAMAADFSGA